jgi:hypothetical protein
MVYHPRPNRPGTTVPAQFQLLAFQAHSAYCRVPVASTRSQTHLERQAEPHCLLDLLDRHGHLLLDAHFWHGCLGAGWLGSEGQERVSFFTMSQVRFRQV